MGSDGSLKLLFFQYIVIEEYLKRKMSAFTQQVQGLKGGYSFIINRYYSQQLVSLSNTERLHRLKTKLKKCIKKALLRGLGGLWVGYEPYRGSVRKVTTAINRRDFETSTK